MAAPEGLPPGFRFHPTDEELVGNYLEPKVRGDVDSDIIPVVDNLYKCEPWELPEMSFKPSTHRQEWYLFGPRDRKYPNGKRTKRATPKGHWKSTGNDRRVLQHNGGGGGRAIVGMKKTLVYHVGRAPQGVRTEWAMHEYRLNIHDDIQLSSFALCRLFKKKPISTQTQVGVLLPSSGSEGMIPLAPAPPPEVPVAADTDVQVTLAPAPLPEVPVAADNDDQVPLAPVAAGWMTWIDDQLNSLEGGSWIDYYYAGCSGTAPDAGCSGSERIPSPPGVTAAVADDDTDNGNINYSGIDDQLILDDDSWIDYFL